MLDAINIKIATTKTNTLKHLTVAKTISNTTILSLQLFLDRTNALARTSLVVHIFRYEFTVKLLAPNYTT